MTLVPTVLALRALAIGALALAVPVLLLGLALGLDADNELFGFAFALVVATILWAALYGLGLAANARSAQRLIGASVEPREAVIRRTLLQIAAIGALIAVLLPGVAAVLDAEPSGAGLAAGFLAGGGLGTLVGVRRLRRYERDHDVVLGTPRRRRGTDAARIYAVADPDRAPEGDTARGPAREGHAV